MDQQTKPDSRSAYKTHAAFLLYLLQPQLPPPPIRHPVRSDDGRLGQMGEQVRRRRFAAFNKAWLHAALQVYPRLPHSPRWDRNR